MAVVLVEFPCSFNGVTSETMVVGSEHDFGTMTAGLVAMGWISEEPATRGVAIDAAPEVKAPEVVPSPVVEPIPEMVPLVEPAPEPTPEPAQPAPQPIRRGKRR
jgi:hypothetical protein